MRPVLSALCILEEKGVYNRDFDAVVRVVGRGIYKVSRRDEAAVEVVLGHLEIGGSVIVAYQTTQKHVHICNIVERSWGGVFIANLEKGENLSWVSDVGLKRMLRKMSRWSHQASIDRVPQFWFLEKLDARNRRAESRWEGLQDLAA